MISRLISWWTGKENQPETENLAIDPIIKVAVEKYNSVAKESSECPCCGRKSATVLLHYAVIPCSMERGVSLWETKAYIPLMMAVCKRCGNMRFHDIKWLLEPEEENNEDT